MNALKKLTVVLGRIWAPALLMLIVLASGYVVHVTADQPEASTALGAALRFGPVI
jgi:hypothetical protein